MTGGAHLAAQACPTVAHHATPSLVILNKRQPSREVKNPYLLLLRDSRLNSRLTDSLWPRKKRKKVGKEEKKQEGASQTFCFISVFLGNYFDLLLVKLNLLINTLIK
jgi:hypothetical protein